MCEIWKKDILIFYLQKQWLSYKNNFEGVDLNDSNY